PLSVHGVGLSLGSAEGLDPAHLRRLAALVREIEPALVSDHLSWSIVGGRYLADLLPLPMTEEALDVVCRHVAQVQEHLQRRILVENPSTYVQFAHSIIPEWEFLRTLSERTGCGILCDVNNIFVSACNHGWAPLTYLDALPPAAVAEIHLAGHSVRQLADGRMLRIDDHGSPVCAEVWSLYREALRRFGPVPTLIEWDTGVPDLAVLLHEAALADDILCGAKETLRQESRRVAA
ncbi:MAG: MNIO family bufferin maturase, partial [Steroidobacteraceae bacterium]